MTGLLNSVAVRTFGITIGLSLGALLIIVAMHVAARYAPAGLPVADVHNWFRVDLLIIGNAALGGVIADAFRWAVGICWRSWKRNTPVTLCSARSES